MVTLGRVRRTSLSVLTLALLPLGGCQHQSPAPSEDRVAEAAQAVHGSLAKEDTNERYPFVVNLDITPGASSTATKHSDCSGTLVSRRWVLTARHCFLGGVDDPPGQALGLDAKVEVMFGRAPKSASPGVFHTVNKSDPIVVFENKPNDAGSVDSIAKDLALVKLDTLVPYDVILYNGTWLNVRPLHPPILPTSGPCFDGINDPFTGTIVGYGTQVGDDKHSRRRRYATYDNIWLNLTDHASYFSHKTSAFLGSYEGMEHGDSGGLLIQEKDGHRILCGVLSSWNDVGAYDWNMYPAVDDPITETSFWDPSSAFYWMSNLILDSNGYFEGECPKSYKNPTAALSNQDSDKDGVLDICDNCPLIGNKDQDYSKCNLCPGMNVVDQTSNCNFEIELEQAYPGRWKANLPLYETNPKYDQALAKHLAAFKPDACDPTPCPRVDQSDPSNSGELPAADVPPAPASCGPLHPCNGWAIDNRINMSPGVSPVGTVNASATIGLRWCACDGGVTDTLKGRVACSQQSFRPCKYDPKLYSNTDLIWSQLVTKSGGGIFTIWSSTNEFPIKTVPLYKDTNHYTYWDFLTGDVASHLDDTDPYFRSVTGILWSSVRQYPQQTFPLGTVQEYGNFYGPGNAMMEMKTSPPPGSGVLEPAGGFSAPWISAPQYTTRFFAKTGDSVIYRASADGLARVRLASPAERTFYSDVASGAVRYIAAAEPPTRLAQITVPGAPMIRGVTLNDTTVSSYVSVTSLDAVPTLGAPIAGGRGNDEGSAGGFGGAGTGGAGGAGGIGTRGGGGTSTNPLTPLDAGFYVSDAGVGGRSTILQGAGSGEGGAGGAGGASADGGIQGSVPVLHGNEGVVLSGALRQLFVIGGTTNGLPNGTPNSSAWLLDTDKGRWTEIPLPPDQRPGAVVGATFRLDDYSVYFADRINGTTRLRRWTPADPIVTELAKLPDTWNVFDRRWLVAGAEGDLLFAATRDQGGGPHQTLLVRFTVDVGQKLALAGLLFSPTRILSEPALGRTGITVVVPHATGAALSSFGLGQLGNAPPGFLPILQ